jgi:hypothetical protein
MGASSLVTSERISEADTLGFLVTVYAFRNLCMLVALRWPLVAVHRLILFYPSYKFERFFYLNHLGGIARYRGL